MDSFEQAVPGPSEVQLGLHLRDLRRTLGLDVAQLAQRSGLDVQVIEALELGHHGADVATLRTLASALGVRIGVIFALWERQALASGSGS